jgi:multidrug efflux system membrane fusion protein
MKTKRFELVLLALLAGCDKPAEPPPPPRPALVMVVGATAAANPMTLVGEVRPRYESSQGFRINGKVIERKVDVGAQVRKGQVLVRLDATDAHLSAAAALADVRAAEASYSLAVAEAERQRQLFARKFISASALDSQEAALKTAQANMAHVKAQASVSANQTQYTQLTADRDGVVTLIQAEPGQVVEAGDIVVKIADTWESEVLVAVPESRMAEVKLQATVAVKLWADRQKVYTGVVREIAPAADSSTRAFNVRVAIKDADAAVMLGMTAGVRFSQPDQAPVQFLVPTSALTERNGKKTVWVIDDRHTVQPREVVAGQFREDGVLIYSGLQAGEQIAVAGVHTLTPNQVVKPILEAAP